MTRRRTVSGRYAGGRVPPVILSSRSNVPPMIAQLREIGYLKRCPCRNQISKGKSPIHSRSSSGRVLLLRAGLAAEWLSIRTTVHRTATIRGVQNIQALLVRKEQIPCSFFARGCNGRNLFHYDHADFLIENVQTQSEFIWGADQVCFVGDT